MMALVISAAELNDVRHFDWSFSVKIIQTVTLAQCSCFSSPSLFHKFSQIIYISYMWS